MKRLNPIAGIPLCLFMLAACSLGASLRSRPAREIAPSETYSVIFYGNRYVGDLETVVFLKPVSSQFNVKPKSSVYYSIVNGISAPVAMKKAEAFFKSNPNYTGISKNRISVASTGQLIGYEIRPLYQPFVYGMPDVLTTCYTLKGKTVSMYVEINPFLKNRRFSGGNVEEGGRDAGGIPR